MVETHYEGWEGAKPVTLLSVPLASVTRRDGSVDSDLTLATVSQLHYSRSWEPITNHAFYIFHLLELSSEFLVLWTQAHGCWPNGKDTFTVSVGAMPRRMAGWGVGLTGVLEGHGAISPSLTVTAEAALLLRKCLEMPKGNSSKFYFTISKNIRP